MSDIIDLTSPSNDLPMSGVIENGSREEKKDGVSLTKLNQLEIEGWRLIESPTGEESHKRQRQLDKAMDTWRKAFSNPITFELLFSSTD